MGATHISTSVNLEGGMKVGKSLSLGGTGRAVHNDFPADPVFNYNPLIVGGNVAYNLPGNLVASASYSYWRRYSESTADTDDRQQQRVPVLCQDVALSVDASRPLEGVDTPDDGHAMIDGFKRFVDRLREGVPLSAFWRGLLLRRHFRRGAGLILALPGGPRPVVRNQGGEIVVESCSFESGVRLEVYPGATLTIAKGVYFNRNVHIVTAGAVSIGRGVKVGWDTVIMDTDLHGHSGKPAESKPVVIEDDVWIGCRVVILKGVHVGSGAIIGAGAIVTKNVPPLAVVASPRATVLFTASAPTD